MTLLEFWWEHAINPALRFLIAVGLFEFSNFDIVFASQFFDFKNQRWIWGNSWWVNDLTHDGGRFLVGIIFAASLFIWTRSFFVEQWRPLRRACGFLCLAMLMGMGTVTAAKLFTNVDCPWSLEIFGEDRPYIHLFADRPDTLPETQCFPAGHASGGFSLMSLYFVFLEYNPHWAQRGLIFGLIVGSIFGLGQQIRGAHFFSHDVWSAAICWYASLFCYTVLFKRRVW